MAVQQQVWPGAAPTRSAPHSPSTVAPAATDEQPAAHPNNHMGTASQQQQIGPTSDSQSTQWAPAADGVEPPKAAQHPPTHSDAAKQQQIAGTTADSGASHRVSAGRAGGPSPLPVSAVATSAAPDRKGSVPTGSDIAYDALMEEQVAHQAQAYLRSPQGQALTGGHDPK